MAAWTHVGIEDGISTFRLDSWTTFFDFLEAEIVGKVGGDGASYIWRGQSQADWSLSTTLDRQLDALGILTMPPEKVEAISQRHLDRFRYAARGRRGISPAQLSENEWWSLGQHFGLATPLLDWSRAPFAALYFCFEDAHAESNEYRSVYALDEYAVLSKQLEIETGPSIEKGRLPIVEIVDPMSDENQRLVSQGGCFTRAPIGTPIERWVRSAFEGVVHRPTLIVIEIPNSDRLSCLQSLNRMNINHLSLFPDLSGASRATNLQLEFAYPTAGEYA